MDFKVLLNKHITKQYTPDGEIDVLKLDDMSFVKLDTFIQLFKEADSYEKMLAIDEQNKYGYSRFLKMWHEERLI